RQPAKAPLL
nr:Chain P, ARG-GLN-PRO-ALA-LYS-ALA-PRO-LEU-LEU [Mycobacteriaceae]6GH4_Q Chain Q, ARG-GLN-PRO-ALA-LYS-ALA-PRO-LEU-LEU [Mycobacteriaceae]6GH4_R Chain R, ARG-GLN-PRO-ALA-LYS-ALA-PRO-LEU-LEU [Mycobacteriaceae]6GH4_Y Chain Y, ARG-GLN-PRO-ALA-LYS-ALA-PRO-LEU-LEU [Mycobacteriaceae]